MGRPGHPVAAAAAPLLTSLSLSLSLQHCPRHSSWYQGRRPASGGGRSVRGVEGWPARLCVFGHGGQVTPQQYVYVGLGLGDPLPTLAESWGV